MIGEGASGGTPIALSDSVIWRRLRSRCAADLSSSTSSSWRSGRSTSATPPWRPAARSCWRSSGWLPTGTGCALTRWLCSGQIASAAASDNRPARRSGELRRRYPQVVVERPVGDDLATEHPEDRRQQTRMDTRQHPLALEERLEFPAVRLVEAVVALGRRLA